MSGDKQIEEMAKSVSEAIKHNSAVDIIRHGLICVNSDGVTRELFDDGYRKASEIFEEIEEGIKAAVSALQFEDNPIHRKVKHETYSSLMQFIKTVEEKYKEEKKKDGNKNNSSVP